MTFLPEVLVVGEGAGALAIARRLSENQVAVHATASARLAGCHGFGGDFQVMLTYPDTTIHKQAGAIVVATEPESSPNFEFYGVTPSSRVMSVSQLEALWNSPAAETLLLPEARIVFLNGLGRESHPVMSGRMLRLCLNIQQHRPLCCYYLTGNLKVADDDLEEICRNAKSAGALFLKFKERVPALQQLTDGRVRIDVWDDTLRAATPILADLVVVDETIAPAADLGRLSKIFNLELSSEGFLQSANVHRLSNDTNRLGIFVAYGARGVLCEDEREAEPQRIALKVLQFLKAIDTSNLPKVSIDPGRCARCLSCYRVCPYAAIKIGERMSIVAEACQSCGLCAAGCPARAIDIEGHPIETTLSALLNPLETTDAGDLFAPRVVAFCCTRSAGEARRIALTMGQTLPTGLVIIEGVCGGSFSNRHLMAAFDNGADGVMVLSCHPGNCHSGQGSAAAQRNADSAMSALKQIGIDAQRVVFGTLAANMGYEFAQQVHVLYRLIRKLGPLSVCVTH